jgi:hypothetical protein
MRQMHRVDKQAHTFIRAISWAGFLAVFIPVLFILGPIWETKLFPVTVNVRAEFIKVDGDRMLFRAWGNKVRQCSLESTQTLILVNGRWVKGVSYVVDDGKGPTTRPLGEQYLGVWAHSPVGDAIKIEGLYNCHGFWRTRTVLGEWHK